MRNELNSELPGREFDNWLIRELANVLIMNGEILDKNIVVKLTFEFALEIVNYCELLESSKKYVIAKQLMKSGTSIGANTWEAQNAESKNDFIHKFKIAAKEVDETKYWLMICERSENYPDASSLLEKIESISKVINKIIGTSKRNKSLAN